MRICHVTPHVPPDQAANALLPYHLGCWARDRGDQVSYVAHPPRASKDLARAAAQLPGPVTWIPTRANESTMERVLKIGTLKTCLAIWRQARREIAAADVVHVHSNGLLAEVAAFVANRAQKPVVMTLYGTEIWHYRPRRLGPDLFTRAYQRAAHVTFYSHGLQSRAVELGLARHQTSVIYPPVASEFVFHDEREQMEARAALGLRQRHVLVNVKRLHPLAGQRFLLEALGEVVRTHPDTRLVVCGTGPLLDELKAVSGQQYVPPFHVALIYASLGKKDDAMIWLKRAVEDRSFNIGLLKVEPMVDNLRSDPRFQKIIADLKFPPSPNPSPQP